MACGSLQRRGRYCCVPWCEHSGQVYPRKVPDAGTSLFRIPRDDRSVAWVAYTGRDDLKTKTTAQLFSSYRICSRHFTPRDFMDPGQTRLTKKAVPSVGPGTQVPSNAPAGRPLLQQSVVTTKPVPVEAARDQGTTARLQETLPITSKVPARIHPDVSEESSSSNSVPPAIDGPVEEVISQPQTPSEHTACSVSENSSNSSSSTNSAPPVTDGPVIEVMSQPLTPSEHTACSVSENSSNSMGEHRITTVPIKEENPAESPTRLESSVNSCSGPVKEEAVVVFVPTVSYRFYKGNEQDLLETINEQIDTIKSLKTSIKAVRDYAAGLRAELSKSKQSLAETQQLCERLQRENARLTRKLSAPQTEAEDIDEQPSQRRKVRVLCF
ncbi:uncharacterized protein LOC144138263 isoform X2 [Haemaphysalis longicornis]